MCTCVCQSWPAGLEIVFFRLSRLTSLWVRITVYSNTVMQEPSSALALSYCPHKGPVSPVSLRSVNQSCSFTRPPYNYTVQPLPFISFTFSPPFTPKKVFESGGPWKSPAVGNCRFYDASEGFPPGSRLQRNQGSGQGQSWKCVLCYACCLSSLQGPKVHYHPTVRPLKPGWTGWRPVKEWTTCPLLTC